MEALDEVLELVSKIYKLRADALEQQVADEKEREQELLQQAAAESMVLPTPAAALTAPANLMPIKNSPQLAPVISATVSERPLNEAPPLPPIPNYSGTANHLGLDGNLNLERKKADAALQKERAERASAAKRQEHTYGFQQPAMLAVAAPAAAPLQPTEEEKMARKEHLKRQREALIEKKNMERQNQLASFQMQHGATNASVVAAAAIQQPQPSLQQDTGKLLAQELSGLASQPTAQLPNPEATAVEMRRMLTRQLRNSFN